MKNMQALALLMMGMIYAAQKHQVTPNPIDEKVLLEGIQKYAEALKNESKTWNNTVFVRTMTDSIGSTCVDTIFCLAETALKKNTELHDCITAKTLTRHLEIYKGEMMCHLVNHNMIRLDCFLEQIMICAIRKLGSL